MRFPTSVTVKVDRRENVPLLFPERLKWFPVRGGPPRLLKVKTLVRTLPAGDYTLDGHEHVCIVERKASLRELYSNLFTKDHARFTAAVERLASSCQYPYLLLDAGAGDLRKTSVHVRQYEPVLDAMSAVVAHYGLRLLHLGQLRQPTTRRFGGEMVLRLMLAHAFLDGWEAAEDEIRDTIGRLFQGEEDAGNE